MDRIRNFAEQLNSDIYTLILIVIIVIGSFIVARLLRWMITRMFYTQDPSPADATRLTFLKNGVSLVVGLIALASIIYTVPKLRSIAVTLFAGAGILLAVIGFAAQQAFANIIGGIFIVVFKPFRVGDFIKVGSLDYGWVEDITLRHTTLRSFQNKRLIIPNSTVSSENIMNDTITDPKICRWIEVGISYDSDIDKAIAIMQEEISAHPLNIDNRSQEDIDAGVPKVVVRTTALGEYSVSLRAFAWAADSMDSIVMNQELLKIIKQRFDREDIEIPFPYRTIVYKSDIPRKSAEDDRPQ